MPGKHTFARTLIASLALATLASCSSMGPRTLDRDQLDYGHSIGESWKNQVLSNLVKMRYVDMPVFVDVGQIVNGYSLETTVTGTLGFGNTLAGGDSQALGAGGRYTDRPTITYMPKTGERYMRSLLEPVDPAAVLALVLAGYNPSQLFTWAVESVNGNANFSVSVGNARPADPGFTEMVKLLTELQHAGAIGFEIRQEEEKKAKILLRFVRAGESARLSADQARLAEILGLEPGAPAYSIVYSPFRIDGRTLGIQTRSVMQMLAAMARFIDVPAERQSRAAPGMSEETRQQVPFRVRSGVDRPQDVFAAHEYQGYWYWIDHDDLASKHSFLMMLFLNTLTNYASDSDAPVLTIPTG